MMRWIIVALAALFLAACEPTAEQVDRVRQALPEGCRLHHLGAYGDIRNLVVVLCDGREATTANQVEKRGKGSAQTTSITID